MRETVSPTLSFDAHPPHLSNRYLIVTHVPRSLALFDQLKNRAMVQGEVTRYIVTETVYPDRATL